MGNYKVNVTSAGGVSCLPETDISALTCATPEDFVNCGSPAGLTFTGTEKLKNLVVGDIFSTYDYVVSVTEVSGSEANGWMGRGVIEMSFLKLGPTAMKVPLAVRFDNIHLNQCYQLLPGSKVITEFDESWSNVVDAQDLIPPLDNTLYDKHGNGVEKYKRKKIGLIYTRGCYYIQKSYRFDKYIRVNV